MTRKTLSELTATLSDLHDLVMTWVAFMRVVVASIAWPVTLILFAYFLRNEFRRTQ